MSQLTGKGAFFRLPLLICEKREILDSDGKMNCINCANKIIFAEEKTTEIKK